MINLTKLTNNSLIAAYDTKQEMNPVYSHTNLMHGYLFTATMHADSLEQQLNRLIQSKVRDSSTITLQKCFCMIYIAIYLLHTDLHIHTDIHIHTQAA